ncbi:MAG: outer membrane protein assembly factor BamC [Aromatoleum sp.]|nr:outer membrane protein assembly factor BamC [Aromatoleum sp.]
MNVVKFIAPARAAAAVAAALLVLAGCESVSLSKKIDYKSVSSAPALELPPDLTSPQYDDRYNVTTASGLAVQNATRPKSGEMIAANANPEAKIVRGGTERWLVAKATPEQAWNTVRQFWLDNGFVLAIEQPALGVMETDWAENRAEVPQDLLRRSIGKIGDFLFSTYKRDKFRARIERGVDPGTVEIYVSHRGMEQLPTAKIDSSSPTAFAWAVLPPNPGLEAEMLSRLLTRFGLTEAQAKEQVQTVGGPAVERARLEKAADGTSRLVVDDNFDRAWRRVGLALDRISFTVVDRDRSTGIYFVRYADPELEKADKGWFTKLQFWKDTAEKPEQYRILVTQADPRCTISVQDPAGAPDKSANGEKILSLLRDQLK